MLQTFLETIEDTRGAKAKQYDLTHVVLFSILAILSGANSYRKIHIFIKEHIDTLKKHFQITWKKIPAYSTIRYIIQGIDQDSLEKAFRDYSMKLAKLCENTEPPYVMAMSTDGKTLRGSFDNFIDKKAIQVLSPFLNNSGIILAHKVIADKTNEIPEARVLFAELGLSDVVYTLDALHCQKKLSMILSPKTSPSV